MTPQRPLADFVKPPEVTPAALTFEWHEVARRVKRRKQVRMGVAVVAMLALSLVGALAVRPGPDTLAPGQVVLTDAASRTLRIQDGSQVFIAPHAGLSLAAATPSEVTVVLEHGRALFEVAKNPARRFVVKAGDVEVRVIGTRFTVTRDERDVSVQVERGIVEVRDGEHVQRLERGQSWARPPTVAAAPTPAAEVVVEPTVDTPSEELAAETPETEPEADVPSRTPSTKRPPRRVPHGNGGGSAVAAAPTTAPVREPLPPVAETPAKPNNEPTPADTFAAAMRARGAGQTKEAIIGFQQVAERWPSSAYAPMGAFEWGRLALDVQHDPRQAARAFERTLELATSESLVEDALARLTEAYARYDVGSCRRVQADYLRRFPEGPHVRGVTKACPP